MRTAFALLLAFLGGCRSRQPPPNPPTAPRAPGVASVPTSSAAATRFVLDHVTVIDVSSGARQADRAVVVDGDRIVAVEPGGGVPASRSSRIVDAHGKYVIPGLWDMHVHFADPASGKLFIANGVTGVRVMWGNPPFGPDSERFHFRMRDAFDKKTEVGPRMVISSQILDGPRPIWPDSVALSTAAEGRRAVGDAKAAGVDFIKVYSLLPREVYFAIADESKKLGLPFEGHLPVAVSAVEASDAGQRSIEHLTGMLLACSSREDALRTKRIEFAKKPHSDVEWSKFKGDELREAAATYDEGHARPLFAKLTANGTWQCPTLTEEHNTAWENDPSLAKDPRMQYVAPFERRQWKPVERPPGEYEFIQMLFEKKVALVGAMNKVGVPLLAGTDEFNPYCFAGFGLHDELEWLVKAGLSPVEALRAATAGPARFFGRERAMGEVAPGYVADLVVLDGDPLAEITNTRRVSAVVSRGVLHERAALDEMLEEAKYAAANSRD